jgi:hypothetical protein
MPLYPIVRRARNARGPHNLIDRSKLNRDGRWVGGKPVHAYQNHSSKPGNSKSLQSARAMVKEDPAGSVVDPPKLEEWVRTSSMNNADFRMQNAEARAGHANIPNLPPEEELVIKNPFSKKNWNFTLRCQIVKYKPELAKKLQLLASA